MIRLSRKVPGTTLAPVPVYWSDSMLYHVMPRPCLKYLGFGPAWIALLGARKRNPSADAVSPMGCDGKVLLGGHDHCIRRVERLRADEVLAQPGQPALPQRRMVVANEWLEPDVASLHDQNGAEACLEVRHVDRLVVEAGECPGKAGSPHHLEKDVRDPTFRNQVANPASQR